MPKYTRKNRLAQNKTSKIDLDDNTSVDDGVSLCSNMSDATSIYDDSDAAYSTTNDVVLSSENLEEKLDTTIDDLRHKDSRTREQSLRTLQTLFSQKYLYELISNRSQSFIEPLTFCLRKGGESEGILAASVSSLFFIQLGEPNDELFLQFRDVIVPVIRDESKSPTLRKHYAQAIGIICFVSCEEILTTVELMKTLETIFSHSYLNEDDASPILEHDVQELHAAALLSWSLLLSTAPNNLAHDLIRIYAHSKIPGLMESSNGELRNQAGETIAVLYEIAREINSVFAEPSEDLLMKLEKKSTESVKYKSKKEKRLQRSTFREIYNWFEEGTAPEFDVRFGRETLDITSWTSRLYYNTFSGLLAAGMNVHLKENNFIRSIFNLEDVELGDVQQVKVNRFERQLANRTAFKTRTQTLKKTRANKTIRSQYDNY